MATITPKKWSEFQHYKDRTPPWIKLHRGLLDNYAFLCLPLASQALAPRLWLLASEYEEGKINASFEELSFRMHTDVPSLLDALKPLVESGFFSSDSALLAECKQEARPERETETQVETETETEVTRKSARNGELAFAGTVIRLNVRDFDKWKKAYSNLDLLAELTARDAWLASEHATDKDRKKWFISTAQHFNNRNAQAIAAKPSRMDEICPPEIYRGLL